MSSGALIPDRRRKYFPLNGGPRPSNEEKERGREGVAAARAALAAVKPDGPSGPTVVARLTPEQIVRARKGIAQARDALNNRDTADQHARAGTAA